MHVKLVVGVPAFTAHEKAQGVTLRRLVVNRNGSPIAELSKDYDPASLTSIAIEPLQYGDKVDLSLRNVDQAGNVSESALDGSMVLVDTVPPDGPIGSFTYQLSEVADPGDEVTTPAAPAPADAAPGDASPPAGQGS